MDENEEIIDDPTPLADDQPNADDTDQDTPPEEPTARAVYFEAKATKSDEAAAKLKQDNKRLEGRVEEAEFGKTTWHRRSKELEEQLETKGRTNGKSTDEQPKQRTKIDLAEMATADDGGERLDAYIEQRASEIAEKIARRTVDSTLQELNETYKVGRQFEGLSDPNSEFSKLTQTIRAEIDADPTYATLPPNVRMELAASRAEIQFQREGKRAKKDDDGKEADRDKRLSRIQNPTGGKRSDKAAPVEIPARVLNAAMSRGLTEQEVREAYDPSKVLAGA